MNVKILAFLLFGTMLVSGCTWTRRDLLAGENTYSTNPSGTDFSGTVPANNTVTVTIYKADSQCETPIAEQEVLPQDRLLERVVGKVIEQATSTDFDIAGYRVTLDPQGQVATVDLRLNPNTRRKFVSLSFCEQFALFGSLRQTLTDNPNWQIQEVRFTQLGKEIIF